MDLVRLATRQPITISVGVLFCLLAGMVALKVVPVQMTPEVEDTVIAVTTTWESASPQEVESEVVDPQEEKLQGLANLRSISSTSSRGSGVIRLEFNQGVNKNVALREVSDKLREVPSYPANVDEPVIEASDPDSQDYIAWYILISEDPTVDIRTLLDFAEDRIKPRLERVPGISEVNVLGGREREVQVRFDPAKLAQHQVPISQCVSALRTANTNVSGGALQQGRLDVRLRTVGRYTSLEQILKTVIRRDDNGPVSIADVATAVETFKEPDSFVRANGVRVLAFNFQREPGSNVLEIMDNLQTKVDELQKPNGLLEAYSRKEGLQGKLFMELSYTSTAYINQALSLVMNNIFIGGSLAVLVLLMFLRSIRSVGILALSIPVSIIGAIVIMVLLGRSINVVSLAGMAFAVGMVVDNCIVVLENIYRHMEMGKGRLIAAYDGTREVAGAVLASTLTTVVVFLPILLITDQVGQLFRDIALAIIASVGFSYLVAITVIPCAGAHLLYKDGKKKGVSDKTPLTQRFIYYINGGLFRRVAVVVIFLVVTAVGTMMLIPPLDYLPKGNRNITFGLMIPPPGYHLDQLDEMGRRIEKIIQPYWEGGTNLPPVPVPFSPSGETVQPAQLNKYFLVARGGVMFHGAISGDSRRAIDNIALFQAATTPAILPGTYAFAFQFPLFRIGGSTGSAIKINLAGSDLDQVSDSTGALFGSLMETFGPGSLRPDPANFNLNARELQIVPDTLRLSEIGMTPAEFGQAVQAVGDGIILGDYDFSGDLIDLKLIAAGSTGQYHLSALPQIPIATPTGKITSLHKLGEFRWIEAAEQIRRVGRQRAISLELTPSGDMPLEDAIKSVNESVAQLRSQGGISPDVDIEIEGTAGKLKEIRKTLFGDGTLSGMAGSSFFLAIAAVYLLMCILFQSWTQPFIIMFSVPLATFGGFIGLALLHHWSINDRYMPVQNLDMLTILGFVILVGVVVNNAILIVAQTNQLMKPNDDLSDGASALPAREAIAYAVQSRVRPIFMSMLTSVGGMLPLVLIPGSGSELYRGLGAVVVGGMLLSTIFTLILVPVLLSLSIDFFDRFRNSRTVVAASAAVGLIFILSGCKTPNATNSETAFAPPATWTYPITSDAGDDISQWWTCFNDPILTDLIERARMNNLDILVGIERLARSRATMKLTRTSVFPDTDFGGAYSRSQYTENIKGNFRTVDSLGNWDLFLKSTWEMDFFGRVREGINAAENEYQASMEDQYDLHVMISADLAQEYLQYRSLQQRESLAEASTVLAGENLALVKARFDAGKATERDVNSANESLALSLAIVVSLEKERAQSLNRICLLVGETTGSLDPVLAERQPLPMVEAQVAVGIPTDLLRRRPDIRKAEFLVDAQASRLKIASTAYYPKFTLTGNIGLNATYLNDLTKSGSKNYQFGPDFEWRILSFRSLKHEVDEQEAALREGVANYRKVVLEALEEVESRWLGFNQEQKRLEQLSIALRAAEASVKAEKALYKNGLSDYQMVIQARANAREKREQVIISSATAGRSLVALYQALGGGWRVVEDPSMPTPAPGGHAIKEEVKAKNK